MEQPPIPCLPHLFSFQQIQRTLLFVMIANRVFKFFVPDLRGEEVVYVHAL